MNYGKSREPSRQPSVASTTNYGPSREPSAAKEAPRLTRESSAASVATRSRSRGFVLPISEEQPSRKETVKKVLQHMENATATNDAKVKASMRMQLSKFARSAAVAPQRQPQKQKRAKSFEELEAEAEIMEQAVPFGSAFQKQRTGLAEPDFRRRFQGRPVRPTSR